MGNIDRELEKLICYVLDRDVITAEDVMAVTTEQTTNKIFEMVNAIAEHNQRKALDLYYDLLTLKEPPMRIMFLITRQFQILLNVRDMAGRGMDNQSIAKMRESRVCGKTEYFTGKRIYNGAVKEGAL